MGNKVQAQVNVIEMVIWNDSLAHEYILDHFFRTISGLVSAADSRDELSFAEHRGETRGIIRTLAALGYSAKVENADGNLTRDTGAIIRASVDGMTVYEKRGFIAVNVNKIQAKRRKREESVCEIIEELARGGE